MRPAELKPLIRLNAEIAPDTPLGRVLVGTTSIGGNMLAVSPDGTRLALTLRGRGRQGAPLHAPTESEPGNAAPRDRERSWPVLFSGGGLDRVLRRGQAEEDCGGRWCGGHVVRRRRRLRCKLGRRRQHHRGVEPTRCPITQIPSSGGTPVPVTKLNSGEATHRWPQVLPGSQTVLFTSATRQVYTRRRKHRCAFAQGAKRASGRRFSAGAFPRYLSSATGSNGIGHLIYMHETTLFAAPFDPVQLAFSGTPAPIWKTSAAPFQRAGILLRGHLWTGNFRLPLRKGINDGLVISGEPGQEDKGRCTRRPDNTTRLASDQ